VTLVLAAALAALAATTTGNRIPTATCGDSIHVIGQPPPPAAKLVLGRVQMPRPDQVLHFGPRLSPGAPVFVKHGWSVTPGAPVVLEVPRRYRRVAGLAFGRGKLGVPALRLRPCPGYAKPWTSWPGGYLVRKPMCVPIIVRADGRRARVLVSVGRRCARRSPAAARLPLPSLTCANSIEIPDEQPPAADALVLGRAELPRVDEVLELGASLPGEPLFAKRGVAVTAGAPVVLEVPRRYRRLYGLALGGGTGRLGNQAVRILPCAASEKAWTTWAGGFAAWRPVCAELFVHADGRTARVPLSLGRRCGRIAPYGAHRRDG